MAHASSKKIPSRGNNKLRKSISTVYESDIFKGVDHNLLDTLFENIKVQNYPAGTILYMPEDSSERIYILKQGRVDVYILTSGGKRLVTRRILPGSVFGMMGLLGQTMQGNFAETIEPSTVYVITREDILPLLKRQPEIAIRILEIVGSRLCFLEERLVEAIFSPVNVRLAHFLLTNIGPDSGTLTDVTHEDIGNMIGAVRQTVTETLSQMHKQGLIETGAKRIHILDRKGLEEIVKGLE